MQVLELAVMVLAQMEEEAVVMVGLEV